MLWLDWWKSGAYDKINMACCLVESWIRFITNTVLQSPQQTKNGANKKVIKRLSDEAGTRFFFHIHHGQKIVQSNHLFDEQDYITYVAWTMTSNDSCFQIILSQNR